jgi:gamma-glutamylcyclotransferase (GGCT)/AIG2-like uncharacterized protein YtfP
VRRNRFARLLAARAQLLGFATVPGRLYALRRYPALRPVREPGDLVHGEVYRLDRPAPTLAILDAYEDLHYRRILTTAELASGRRLRCWVYEWTTPLPSHRRAPLGVWPVE